MGKVNASAFRGALAVATLLALVAAPGCDWLKSSGPGGRSSPVLASLSVEGADGILCGPDHPFEVSFGYRWE